MPAARIAGLSLCLLCLAACGASRVPVDEPPPEARSAAEPPPRLEMEAIWSHTGRVSSEWGLGEHATFVVAEQGGGRRGEPRLFRIDRASRVVTSRAIGEEVELIRVDPLIVNTWDGQMARWRGTRVAMLSDTLEWRWRSDLMNFSPPDHHSGSLVIVEQSQMGEYVGLDPADGRVAFRLRTEPDGIFNEAVQADTFIVVPTMDRALLTDRETGEISGVVEAAFGAWEVVGDRLVVTHPDRLVAYDGRGREVWSRAGEFPRRPARTVLGWSPDDPPGHSDTLVVWERGRGLVALDDAGRERWLYPLVDEAAWGRLLLLHGQVRIGDESITTVLDARSGEPLFACAGACAVRGADPRGALVEEVGSDGAASLAYYARDGERRWSLPRPEGEDGEPTDLGVALMEHAVATCPPSGPLTFRDREGGRALSVHELPSVPEDQNGGSPYCSLRARDGLVLATTEQGAALFGPARDGATEPPAATPADEPTVITRAAPPAAPRVRVPPEREAEPSGPPPLYVLSTLAPPASGSPPQAYTDGRAAYRRGRESFEAGRFEEAAARFIEAYRAFFAADDGAVQQLGLECCYDARVSLDHGGGEAMLEAFLARLPEADERCRGIMVRAPRPSVPF